MRLFDRPAAAAYLAESGVSVSRHTIRNWHLAGQLPVRYIGSKAFNSQEELDRVIHEGLPLARPGRTPKVEAA